VSQTRMTHSPVSPRPHPPAVPMPRTPATCPASLPPSLSPSLPPSSPPASSRGDFGGEGSGGRGRRGRGVVHVECASDLDEAWRGVRCWWRGRGICACQQCVMSTLTRPSTLPFNALRPSNSKDGMRSSCPCAPCPSPPLINDAHHSSLQPGSHTLACALIPSKTARRRGICLSVAGRGIRDLKGQDRRVQVLGGGFRVRDLGWETLLRSARAVSSSARGMCSTSAHAMSHHTNSSFFGSLGV
jgi:hypothetical protein